MKDPKALFIDLAVVAALCVVALASGLFRNDLGGGDIAATARGWQQAIGNWFASPVEPQALQVARPCRLADGTVQVPRAQSCQIRIEPAERGLRTLALQLTRGLEVLVRYEGASPPADDRPRPPAARITLRPAEGERETSLSVHPEGGVLALSGCRSTLPDCFVSLR